VITIRNRQHAAQVFKHLRLGQDIERTTLARRLFVSPKTVANREQGVAGLSVQTVIDTARALGFTVALMAQPAARATPHRNGMAHMIRLTDPTRIGPALAEVRGLLGITRRQLSRDIAAKTGRTETSVNAQLWTWDVGRRHPDLASLPLVLDALGYDLALIPREDA
jgi:DNA-binding XRE family transcriptional regulator